MDIDQMREALAREQRTTADLRSQRDALLSTVGELQGVITDVAVLLSEAKAAQPTTVAA